MTPDEVTERLTRIFRAVFADDALVLRPSMTARDVEGWDSAKMVTLILEVEDAFNIRLRGRDIDALRSVGDFEALIGRLVARNGPP